MSEITTAAALLSYRSELLAGGISEETADAMTRDAAGMLIQNENLVIANA